MSNGAYEPITDKEFDRRLAECLDDLEGWDILQIPGVYEAVSEHFNNQILEDYAEENEDFRTYDDVKQDFEENILPSVIEQYGADDVIAIREAWNDWTDALCKDHEISSWAYENWDNPY